MKAIPLRITNTNTHAQNFDLIFFREEKKNIGLTSKNVKESLITDKRKS